jgi:hypothetical protein
MEFDMLKKLLICLIIIILTGCTKNTENKTSSDSDADVNDADDVEVLQETDLNEKDEIVLPDLIQDSENEIKEYSITENGVTANVSGNIVKVTEKYYQINIDLQKGTFDIYDGKGSVILLYAVSKAVFSHGDSSKEIWTSDPDLVRTVEGSSLSDSLGKGLKLKIKCKGFNIPVTLATVFYLYKDISFVNISSSLGYDGEMPGPAQIFTEISVTEIDPVIASFEKNSGLFINSDPSALRIMDNGYDIYFDIDFNLNPLGWIQSILFGPGQSSNWNVAVYDPQSGKSFLSGFLTFERAAGLMMVDYVSEQSIDDPDTKRKSLSLFSGRNIYQPYKKVQKDEILASEIMTIDFNAETPAQGLEDYAKRISAYHGKKPWSLDKSVPSSWNSWGGGSGSGGYGQDINEILILINLNLMEAELKPFGMDYFCIDDGWQKAYGDWETNSERFPQHSGMDGMQWMAMEIKKKGLKPGLWIAPFTVYEDSDVFKNHPDWMLQISDMGKAIVPKGTHAVDLSNPEVQQWLKGIFKKIVVDWGYEWIKLDFGYYTLLGKDYYEKGFSSAEAYRTGMKIVKEALGQNGFLLGVAIMGFNYDIVDGMRISLDNMPQWGDKQQIGDQGIKVTMETAARRYYFNHNIWINHPDLLFFRDDFGLTMQEAKAWASFVGITGGIVKSGESFVDLDKHPDWLYVIRSLIPVYPHSARPLDLFGMRYPEIWSMPVKSKSGKEYSVLGLFNWGLNVDIADMSNVPDEQREKKVQMKDMGLKENEEYIFFEFWNQEFAGIFKNEFKATLPAHSAKVYAIRRNDGIPMLIGTDRHILMGVVEIEEENWDDSEKTLTLKFNGVKGQQSKLSFYVPLIYNNLNPYVEDGTLLESVISGSVMSLTLLPAQENVKIMLKE